MHCAKHASGETREKRVAKKRENREHARSLSSSISDSRSSCRINKIVEIGRLSFIERRELINLLIQPSFLAPLR